MSEIRLHVYISCSTSLLPTLREAIIKSTVHLKFDATLEWRTVIWFEVTAHGRSPGESSLVPNDASELGSSGTSDYMVGAPGRLSCQSMQLLSSRF